MFPHLGVPRLPPEVTVDGLLTVDFLQALLDTYDAALALQAADTRWHSTATPRARRSYRAVHRRLDPEPYHAHLIGLWEDCIASIAERLSHAAPTSGSAPPAAVAATVDAVSGHANVVGPSIVPAGDAAGAAVPAAMILRAAPTSGPADSAGQLATPAPADAVAAAVNAVSGDADVVGTSVVPAGNAARADVRADVLVAYQAAYRAVRVSCSRA